jgi:hypothetical protein
MPDIIVKNSGPRRIHLTLSADSRGEHPLEPGAQAKIVCVDDEHLAFVKGWLDRYGMEHSDKPFKDCGEPTVIHAKPPKREG